MAEIIRMEGELGIHKHKCATIAEAEMVAAAGGTDVLLAYPLVGPNLVRFTRLVRGYPATTFRAVVDHPDSARALARAAAGPRSAGSGPGRSRCGNGPDRDRSRRAGREALRDDRQPARPGPRWPARL